MFTLLITLYLFVTDSKHIVSAIHDKDIWSCYNYSSERLLVPSVGGANTSVTLSGLEPGTTYRIRVWSTDGTSVSSEAGEIDVTTVESGECFVHASVGYCFREARCCLVSHSALPSLCTAAVYHI